MAARGRRPSRRRPSNAPTTSIGKMLQDYFLKIRSVDFNALAAGGEIRLLLVDNDVDYTNAILKWKKLTIRPFFDADDLRGGLSDIRSLAVMVMKQDQDDSTVYDVSDEETVRELRTKKRIVRGPWFITTHELVGSSAFIPMFAGHLKPIVLKNMVLDREEDLIISFHNLSAAFGSNSQKLHFAMTGYVRVIK